MNAMKLINTQTNQQINEGDTVTTFRGETGILKTACPLEGKNGKVYVQITGKDYSSCFYPSVIGAEFR